MKAVDKFDPKHGGKQHDAAIAILDVGAVSDRVE
jgi:hypothetical protein